MNNNNIDMAKLMSMLSKMDKKQLEDGLKKANDILKSKQGEDFMKNLKN